MPTMAAPLPVEVHAQGGLVERLLDSCVGDARHAGDAGEKSVGIGAVLLQIVAHDLQIDRCRQTEIDDLGDNIRGQQGKHGAGEQVRQDFAHPALVAGSGGVFQGNQDVGILYPDGAGIAVSEIDAADRHANVVNDRVEVRRRDDARADRILDPADER